jgi:hypothetical protein
MEATAKTTKANVKAGKPNTTVRKSKFTEYWEKYPEGLLTVVDRRAVLK